MWLMPIFPRNLHIKYELNKILRSKPFKECQSGKLGPQFALTTQDFKSVNSCFQNNYSLYWAVHNHSPSPQALMYQKTVLHESSASNSSCLSDVCKATPTKPQSHVINMAAYYICPFLNSTNICPFHVKLNITKYHEYPNAIIYHKCEIYSAAVIVCVIHWWLFLSSQVLLHEGVVHL